MELINGNCGSLSNDTDDEEDSSRANSPVNIGKIVPSPPLPPRRSSPSPTSSSHLRNGRHLTVPKENAPPPPPPPPPPPSAPSSVTVILSSSDNHHNNKVNMEARYDMLHRASSPCAAPLMAARSQSSRSHRSCPGLASRQSAQSSHGQNQHQQPSSNVPPVPPPLSAPRPPKASKDNSKQDHHYENTIIIPGTRQHIVKNINNLEVNRAKFNALMKAQDESAGSISKVESTAAYENVNVEHISKLTALGFAQDAVIRALGITRNDLEMACDILHEFATKSS